MNFKGLDLNLLVALDALLAQRSVTRAGEALHITQSAMSSCLARLRGHFGDALLVPVGRQMQLTPVAQDLVQPVRALLLQVEAVVQARPVFDPATATRRFRVMASDYGATVLVAAVLRAICDSAPHVGLDVLPFSDAPHRSLDEGDIDLLLFARGLMVPGHPLEVLFEDRLVGVAWTGNRHATGTRLDAATFGRLAHVVARYGTQHAVHIDERFLGSIGLQRQAEVVVGSFHAVPHMVVGTQRIATLHRRLAALYAQSMPLRLLELPAQAPPMEEAMQWHSLRDNDPGGQWLREQFRRTAAALRGQG